MIQRLGILGGTFDPIHHGHLVAAGEAHHQLELDRVLFVPAGDPPHKPREAEDGRGARGARETITSVPHRLRMLQLAIAANPHFGISHVDLERPGPCYTLDTLRILRGEWGPKPIFYFIEGADSLAEILTWHQPQRLIELCELAVVQRPGITIDLAWLDERLPGLAKVVHWVQMPCLEISSSGLRERVRVGRSITYLLPPNVESYIREQGLYRNAAYPSSR